MIKSVTVTNYIGESKTFILADPYKSGFLIDEITGLGPPDAAINTTDMASIDGSIYNSSRLGNRNIVMSLRLLFNPQVEDTRHASYKYLPIKKKVTLVVETDSRICETYGYVETNEVDIFSKEESTMISIICPDPYFHTIEPTITTFYGIEPKFEFVWSNESLTEDLIEFGEILRRTEQTVWYTGDAEVGVKIFMHAIGPVRNISVYNVKSREVMRIYTDKIQQLTGSGIGPGDDIIINSIRGQKSVQLLRNGLYTNIINCINRDADWFLLRKGDNLFTYIAEDGLKNLTFRIENQILYEGV